MSCRIVHLVNNDSLATTLNEYVKKDKVIDKCMKEIKLDVNISGGYFYVYQLYNDENVRQAIIDNGINIDGYLYSDSSTTFKGYFNYVKTEDSDIFFQL